MYLRLVSICKTLAIAAIVCGGLGMGAGFLALGSGNQSEVIAGAARVVAGAIWMGRGWSRSRSWRCRTIATPPKSNGPTMIDSSRDRDSIQQNRLEAGLAILPLRR